MNARTKTPEEMARLAYDEMCIRRTMARVAHAQDDLDPVAYRKCFTDMVMLSSAVMFPNWTAKEIPADELTRMTFEKLGGADAGHHMVTNHIIEIDGDQATCHADLYAISVLTDDAETTSATMGGRYFLRLRRQGDDWLIYERSVKLRYRAGDPKLAEKAAARKARRQAANA